MPDDNRFYPEDNQPDPWEQQPSSPYDESASAAFMELMRRAAQNAAPPQTPEVPYTPPPTQPMSNAFSEPTQYVPRAHVEPMTRPASRPPDQTRVHTEAAPTTVSRPVSAEQTQAAPLTPEQLEAQRIRRIKRRQQKRRQRTVGTLGGCLRTLIVSGMAGILMATILSWWTPPNFLQREVQSELSVALATSQATTQPTPLPSTPNWLKRIGIVSGHRGPENDPGAVCPDGLTEAEINFAVAQLVVRALRGRGYSVDLLDEFDPRLDNYQAAALVSIHANTCQDFGELVSGYLIAAPAARTSARGSDDLLVNCVARHYEQASGLPRRDGVTVDMTDYHSFREIHPLTPGAILELGFLLGDRQVLTTQQDALARGITDGVLCFLEPGVTDLTPQPPVAAATPGA